MTLTDAQVNWRAMIKIVRNILATEHERTLTHELISRKSCDNLNKGAGSKRRIVRILYATDRTRDAAGAPAAAADIEKLYTTDLDSKLHIGCLEVEVGRSDGEIALASNPKLKLRYFAPSALQRPVQLLSESGLEDFDLSFLRGSRSRGSGEQIFQSAGCVQCHRSGSQGGDLGPDLTSLGFRMDRRAILESILSPSRAIDEKYQVTQLVLKNGSDLSGILIQEDARHLVLATGASGELEMEAASEQIVTRKLSVVSPMPEGLLSGLSRDQVLDLLGFLETEATESK